MPREAWVFDFRNVYHQKHTKTYSVHSSGLYPGETFYLRWYTFNQHSKGHLYAPLLFLFFSYWVITSRKIHANDAPYNMQQVSRSPNSVKTSFIFPSWVDGSTVGYMLIDHNVFLFGWEVLISEMELFSIQLSCAIKERKKGSGL